MRVDIWQSNIVVVPVISLRTMEGILRGWTEAGAPAGNLKRDNPPTGLGRGGKGGLWRGPEQRVPPHYFISYLYIKEDVGGRGGGVPSPFFYGRKIKIKLLKMFFIPCFSHTPPARRGSAPAAKRNRPPPRRGEAECRVHGSPRRDAGTDRTYRSDY